MLIKLRNKSKTHLIGLGYKASKPILIYLKVIECTDTKQKASTSANRYFTNVSK
jgi:hypothetical protein